MVFPSVVRLFFGWGGSERPTGRVAAAVASRGPADVPALPILRPRLRGAESGRVPGADPVVLPYGTGASTPACVASRIAAGRLAAAGRPWDASFPRPDGPDGGKARFRLMTDMLHLGGEKGSVLFGVTRQTVFAWRHPRMRDSVPSPAAVDALDARWSAMVARASELAGMMSVAADRAAADGRRRMAPPLTFYRLRSDWEAWHGPDDGGWRRR